MTVKEISWQGAPSLTPSSSSQEDIAVSVVIPPHPTRSSSRSQPKLNRPSQRQSSSSSQQQTSAATLLQAVIRSFLVRQRRNHKAATIIALAFRSHCIRQEYSAALLQVQNAAATVIQHWWHNIILQDYAATRIAAWYRGTSCRRQYLEIMDYLHHVAAIVIQRAVKRRILEKRAASRQQTPTSSRNSNLTALRERQAASLARAEQLMKREMDTKHKVLEERQAMKDEIETLQQATRLLAVKMTTGANSPIKTAAQRKLQFGKKNKLPTIFKPPESGGVLPKGMSEDFLFKKSSIPSSKTSLQLKSSHSRRSSTEEICFDAASATQDSTKEEVVLDNASFKSKESRKSLRGRKPNFSMPQPFVPPTTPTAATTTTTDPAATTATIDYSKKYETLKHTQSVLQQRYRTLRHQLQERHDEVEQLQAKVKERDATLQAIAGLLSSEQVKQPQLSQDTIRLLQKVAELVGLPPALQELSDESS